MKYGICKCFFRILTTKKEISMYECKNCRKTIKQGNIMSCPNCGATICANCAKETKSICPYCYSDLDYFG